MILQRRTLTHFGTSFVYCNFFFFFILTASVLQSESLFAWTSKIEASQNDAGITLSLKASRNESPGAEIRALRASRYFVNLPYNCPHREQPESPLAC